MKHTQLSRAPKYDNSNDNYPEFEQWVKMRFDNISVFNNPLFMTDVENLFDIFIANLPEPARQHYTCTECRRFVNRFGGIVTVDEFGNAIPVMWLEKGTPEFFVPSVKAMIKAINKAAITKQFFHKGRTLGTPQTDEWTHLSVSLPYGVAVRNEQEYDTDGQHAAKTIERFDMLKEAFDKYDVEPVNRAITYFMSESLPASDMFLGIAERFKELIELRSKTKNTRLLDNMVWRAVAVEPLGLVRIKNTPLGTLLDDIVDGLSFTSMKNRFSEKVDGINYKRPKADPTAGGIDEAEKLVEKHGIRNSFRRRFARLDEIQTIWKPVADVKTDDDKAEKPEPGLFANLKAKVAENAPAQPMDVAPAKAITWEKFRKTILPVTKKIEIFIQQRPDNFSSILTAADETAPPIIQWDSEEQRNPFTTYVYHGGSVPSAWGITAGYNTVTGICYQPSMWNGDQFEHHGKSIFLLIEGAKDINHEGHGIALFPSNLKSYLHKIRSVIEAYSRDGVLEGFDEASAAGIVFASQGEAKYRLRVTTTTGVSVYDLDRWE